MRRITLLATMFTVLASSTMVSAARATNAQLSQAPDLMVDSLFAAWDRPGMPGAVVEVIRAGKVVLSKGYGYADLEHNVPMTPSASFAIGSNSKQFTALSIYLLAQDGKLALDDDIRKYVPEVPDFGKAITIRQLLHHTSGLRDYFELMFLKGAGTDAVITQEDVLALVKRQRALNFAPGHEYAYSNTGYLLLGQIIQRVSGMPLAEFARVRIFDPLGMKHTQFQNGCGTLVPQRVLSYLPSGAGGYDNAAVCEAADGAGGVVTTAGDLALWDRNFYDGRVGGIDLLAQMQVPGKLGNGQSNNYASALVIDAYRGRRIVKHGGDIRGFHTQLTRFPDQHFSVVVLANSSDLDKDELVRKIADIYLDHVAPAAPAAPMSPERRFREVAFDPAGLDALVGYYALPPQSGVEGVHFTKENGYLWAQGTGQARIRVFAYGERSFFAKAINAQFTFDAPGKDGVVAGGVLHQGGVDMPVNRPGFRGGRLV
ncbi:beta-lactamase family protein (plasmid) [Massilia forsythiae]|uniref:Beta-lactamase family protein n=1 Tax=Massilia forsythiae TaxID=2728020 RepID=A0A7Z2ZVT8_9BURK|nr:serine hydrolase domain-containing protein [Massilia forsythiae]QJE03655.1 beta-lactamase family protein [Massilia forsythiae]